MKDTRAPRTVEEPGCGADASEPSRTSSGTSCGPTRRNHSMSKRTSGRPARTAGPGSGEPVVFLHGSGGTALTWSRVRRAVSTVAPRYAIDTIGDVGRSEQRVAVADAADLSRWLDETLARARPSSGAHLVGISYGGFLALNQAARRPSACPFAHADRPRWSRTAPLRPLHCVGHVGDGGFDAPVVTARRAPQRLCECR